MYIDSTKIAYPVFYIGNNKPIEDNGIIYFEKFYEYSDGKTAIVYRVVDDISYPGKNLSKRRLEMLSKGEKLHKLKYAFFFINDLIKFAKSNMWFIDSAGKVFKYKKSRRCKLKCFKIKTIISNNSTHIVLLEGVSTRFKTLYRPKEDMRYAGVLEDGLSLILYGFFKEPFRTTTRAI